MRKDGEFSGHDEFGVPVGYATADMG